MELVVTGQDTQVLALDKVIGTDGTRKVARVMTRFRRRSRAFALFFCRRRLIRRWVGGGGRRRGSRLNGFVGGGFIMAVLILTGLGIQHFDITFDGIAPAPLFFISKLDDGNGFEHGTGDSSRATLAGSTGAISRSVPFGMTMCTYGASDDDDQKQNGDDTSDTIQDNHGFFEELDGQGYIDLYSRVSIPVLGLPAELSPLPDSS